MRLAIVLLAVVAAPIALGRTLVCKDGWKLIDDRCFKIDKKRMTRGAAGQKCVDVGGILAKADTWDVVEQLKKFIKADAVDQVWTGGICTKSCGTTANWSWGLEGTIFGAVEAKTWHTSPGTQKKPVTGIGHGQCAAMDQNGFENLGSCDQVAPSMCEMDATVVTPEKPEKLTKAYCKKLKKDGREECVKAGCIVKGNSKKSKNFFRCLKPKQGHCKKGKESRQKCEALGALCKWHTDRKKKKCAGN